MSEKMFSFDNVFREKSEYIAHLFDIYDKIYDLKKINFEATVSKELYNYIEKRKFFVLMVIYDENGKIFLERNIQNELYWALPGGSILKDEDIHVAVKRISNRIFENNGEIILGEIEPIARIYNIFRYNKKTYIHYGIAFIARLRNRSIAKLNDMAGSFVYPSPREIEKINRYANKEVVRVAIKRIKKFSTLFPEKEIAINEKYKFRYLIHNNIIKKFLLTSHFKKKKKIVSLITSMIGNAENFLDVSCGDSDLILDVAKLKNINYLVGNDISWSQIKTINKNNRKVLFTNHNAEYLPFRDNAFDVAYCGNTLHHMPEKQNLINLLNSIFLISKKIIVFEIEKPKNTGFFAYLLNKYWYTGFLKDVGDTYLTRDDFENIINSLFKNLAEIKFSEFKNIQGKYLIAEITKKNLLTEIERLNKKIEVEKKYICKNINRLISKCLEMGFKLKQKINEDDTYYTDFNGKFITNRTCLRLRITSDNKKHGELTFKGKSTSLSGTYAKEEHNIPIVNNGDLKTYSDILAALGYYKYIDVLKKRIIYTKQISELTYTIAIDEIKDVGNFVEFEILADYEKFKEHKNHLAKLLENFACKYQTCDLSEANEPYRDYVAKINTQKIFKQHKIKAVLFDFDGTIIPSEELFYKSYQKISQEIFGINVKLEDYKKFELDQNNKLFDYLFKKKTDNKSKISKEKFLKIVYREYEKKLKLIIDNDNVITNFKGIKLLKSKYRLGIVSTSRRKYVDLFIKQYNLEQLFEIIVTREDVKNLKPAPDAYINALNKLNLKSDEVLTVEDSQRGIAAAKTAKIPVIATWKNSLCGQTNHELLKTQTYDNVLQICLLLIYAK